MKMFINIDKGHTIKECFRVSITPSIVGPVIIVSDRYGNDIQVFKSWTAFIKHTCGTNGKTKIIKQNHARNTKDLILRLADLMTLGAC